MTKQIKRVIQFMGDVCYKMLLTEWKLRNNKPILYSIGRNDDGTKYQKEITNFLPYFYILRGEEYLYRRDKRVVDIIDEGFVDIKERQVVKIVVQNPFDIRDLIGLASENFEGDIEFNTRYAIDQKGELKKEPIATCFIDIETDHDKTFPSPREAKFPITAITCYNTLIEKMVTFVWREDLEQKVEKTTRHLQKENITYNDTTIFFNNEREMLSNFLSYIRDTDIDIFSAWNVGFDLGFIVQRLYNIALDHNRLSPFGIVTKEADRVMKDKDNIHIKGRIIFDLLDAYKKIHFKQLDSYKLDDVTEQELGEKKVVYTGTLANLWREDLDTFISYNKKDVELLVRLDYKNKIIDRYDEVRRMSKCRFEDLFESTKVTDAFILSFCKDLNIVLPSKGFHSKEKFAGATVLTPKKGLHEYVSVFDFKSLYPKIISCLNCSPETLTTKTDDTVNLRLPYLDNDTLELQLDVKSHRQNIIHEFAKFTEDYWDVKTQSFLKVVPNKFLQYLSYKNISYRQDKKGILPGIMEYLFNKRIEIQKERDKYEYDSEEYNFYEGKQYAFKVMLNSFYGVVSYKGFRLYTPEIGASITFIGRNAILWSKKKCEKKGYLLIAGDTDSVFVHIGNKYYATISSDLVKYLQSTYDDFSKIFNMNENHLKLEYEKTFERIVIGDAKKRYAGKICYYKGKEVNDMLIMGFEMVRSDSSKLGKQVQKTFFDMLFLENKDKKELIKYLKGVIGDIRNKKYSYDDIGIPTPLNKPINEYVTNLPVVRAVEFSNNELELDLRPGEKFKLLYVKDVPFPIKTDVIGFREKHELPEGIVVDIERHVKEAVKDKMERIFYALGWNLEELETNGSLLDF